MWIGSLLFAAFGLFTGYLLPSENVTQVISLALTLFCFGFGGLFIPLSQFPPDIADPGQVHPAVRAQPARPLPAAVRHLQWDWILNLVVWLTLFVVGAAWACTATPREYDPASITRPGAPVRCGLDRSAPGGRS